MLCPLFNVHISSESIELSRDLKIRKTTSDEIEDWFNPSFMLFDRPASSYDLTNIQCAIDRTVEHKPFDPGRSFIEAKEEIFKALNAIQIFFDCEARIAFMEERGLGILCEGRGLSWPNSSLIFNRGKILEIDRSEETRFVEFWKRYTSVSHKSSIGLALNRWGLATDRFEVGDKLIDYWIALEALFNPDLKSELRFTAALRIAAYIGTTADERKSIFKDMKQSYDYRSNIVHGSAVTKEKISKAIAETRSYLRRTLLKILESDETFDPSQIELFLLGKA